MSKKALVIGLDGVPHNLLVDCIERGITPHLGRLVQEGSLSSMEVTQPPISSVSWTSFMTGMDPSHHGIYGFTDVNRTYGLTLPSFRDVKTKTIFDRLGEIGLSSVVLNLPATYPARSIPGVLVSGFVAPDLQKGVAPASLYPKLKKMHYTADIDLPRVLADKRLLFPELERTLLVRQEAVDMLWEESDWSLFMVVVTGTDRLHHYAFDAYTDASHPDHDRFYGYYARVDAFVGTLMKRFESDFQDHDRFHLVLSDHGFGPLETEVYLNTVLHRAGLLEYAKPDPRMISDIDPARTQAFAMDPSRIYLNRKSRFAGGTVQEDDAEGLLDDLESLFMGLRFRDTPVIAACLRREELYTGPLAQEGPDMVLIPHPGRDLKGMMGAPDIFGKKAFTGMHTHNDAFAITSHNAAPDHILGASRAVMNFFGIDSNS
ncbi:alkaline phosphatase family protein [Desulfovibrio inopinatus]|uniref:alkaline phosphatase family protein n=1 Tax=Desulfovibrio inopinatus TaxID=102109 RepID=UPI000411E531|nr:alkaline phosphatase family protein [Desulfovibrio inopinatus]